MIHFYFAIIHANTIMKSSHVYTYFALLYNNTIYIIQFTKKNRLLEAYLYGKYLHVLSGVISGQRTLLCIRFSQVLSRCPYR